MEIKNEPLVKIDCKQSLVRAVRYNGKSKVVERSNLSHINWYDNLMLPYLFMYLKH